MSALTVPSSHFNLLRHFKKSRHSRESLRHIKQPVKTIVSVSFPQTEHKQNYLEAVMERRRGRLLSVRCLGLRTSELQLMFGSSLRLRRGCDFQLW